MRKNIYIDKRQISKNLIKLVDGRRLELILNMDNAFRINVGFINLSLFHYNNLFLFLFKFLKNLLKFCNYDFNCIIIFVDFAITWIIMKLGKFVKIHKILVTVT